MQKVIFKPFFLDVTYLVGQAAVAWMVRYWVGCAMANAVETAIDAAYVLAFFRFCWLVCSEKIDI